jgi:hypothetical protein
MSMLERGQWPRVKAIFQTLMERPEGEWDAGLRDLAAPPRALDGDHQARDRDRRRLALPRAARPDAVARGATAAPSF